MGRISPCTDTKEGQGGRPAPPGSQGYSKPKAGRCGHLAGLPSGCGQGLQVLAEDGFSRGYAGKKFVSQCFV